MDKPLRHLFVYWSWLEDFEMSDDVHRSQSVFYYVFLFFSEIYNNKRCTDDNKR